MASLNNRISKLESEHTATSRLFDSRTGVVVNDGDCTVATFKLITSDTPREFWQPWEVIKCDADGFEYHKVSDDIELIYAEPPACNNSEV